MGSENKLDLPWDDHGLNSTYLLHVEKAGHFLDPSSIK